MFSCFFLYGDIKENLKNNLCEVNPITTAVCHLIRLNVFSFLKIMVNSNV